MPELLEKKVGIISCSGEELAEGTVSRLATLKVLHELRRGQTVTLCLPLFLAGGEEERTFARFYPTITVDGCPLRCAAHGTEAYSARPTASVVVSELAAERGVAGIAGRRCLNAAGRQAVELAAARIAALVDDILGGARRPAAAPAAAGPDAPSLGCSCGSGLPARVLTIAGQPVEVAALPRIFDQLRDAGRAPTAQEILDQVKVYNYVPPEAEAAWREALADAFAREVPR